MTITITEQFITDTFITITGNKIRKMLSFLFVAKGFEVDNAENGIEALDMLNRVTPRVIIVDLMMPEMDGFEFCKRVKEDPRLKNIPLIVLSAISPSEYTDRVEALDIYACIEKPFRSVDVVNKALEAIGS